MSDDRIDDLLADNEQLLHDWAEADRARATAERKLAAITVVVDSLVAPGTSFGAVRRLKAILDEDTE